MLTCKGNVQNNKIYNVDVHRNECHFHHNAGCVFSVLTCYNFYTVQSIQMCNNCVHYCIIILYTDTVPLWTTASRLVFEITCSNIILLYFEFLYLHFHIFK